MLKLGNSRVGLWIVLAVVGAMSGTVMADIALPKPEPVPEPKPAEGVVAMTVVAEQGKKQPAMRLVISSAAAKEMGIGGEASGGSEPGAKPSAKADGSLRTIVAGVSISAALMLGGIAMFRSGGSKNKTMLLLAAAGSLTVGGFVASSYANAPPPRNPIRPAPIVGIQIVVSDDAEGVKLHVTETQMQQLVRAYSDSAQRQK